jgi:hypothetical protein
MNESEFISHIDCAFPYNDLPEWQRLVRLGATLSANAAFMVLHEICIPPRSAQVTSTQQLEMIDYWSSRFSHPLANQIRAVAIGRIAGERLDIDAASRVFKLVADHPGQYNALNIVYFSCGEFDELTEQFKSAVTNRWQAAV